MGFTSIPQTLINVGKAVTQKLLQYIKDNFDYFNTKVSTLEAANVPNGSFEIDSDADDKPDTWTVNTYSSGAAGLTPSEVIGTDQLNYTCIADHTAADSNKPVTGASWSTYWAKKGSAGSSWMSGKKYKSQVGSHGKRCMWFEHPGGPNNGGGNIESDYVPAGLITQKLIVFGYKCSVAGIKVVCELLWLDQDKVSISTTTAFSRSADNPLNWAMVVIGNVPRPVNARFFKIRLVGGATDVDQAGMVWLDNVELVDEPQPVMTSMSEAINQGQVYWYRYFFTDAASQTINIPTGVGHLYVEAEVYSGSSTVSQAYARMRIGSRYSSEITGGGEGYKRGFLILNVEGLSGAQTLVFQGRGSLDGVYWYFRSPSTLRRMYTPRGFIVDVMRNQSVERALYRDIITINGTVNTWWATDTHCLCPCTCTCTCTCTCPSPSCG